MAITADQAFDLADGLRDCSVAIGDHLYANWDTLTPSLRRDLEREEIDLRTFATRVRVRAVGIVLDDVDASVSRLKKATKDATEVITRIKDAKRALEIGTAVVTLAGAIVSENPQAIASALQGLIVALQPPAKDK